MRRILTSLMFVASVYSFAQVGVSKDASEAPRATLDVRAMEGNTPDGILIPNVNKDRAQNMSKPEDSTLAYITNTGAGGDRTTDVDADGFYYFKDTKWIKLGGGASQSSSVKSRDIGYTFKSVTTVSPGDFDGVDAVIFTSGEGNTIPAASAYKGKSIILINNSGYNVTLEVEGGASILPGSGVKRTTSSVLASDGTTWYRMSN